MINAAERSLAALAERDGLEALQQKHRTKSHPATSDQPDSDSADADEDSGQVDAEFDESPDLPDNIQIRPPPSPSTESPRRLKNSPLRNLIV